METRAECCANCRFFCQEVDAENRLYYDSKSGECRSGPPRDHFVWLKTRTYHWCGQWQSKERRVLSWRKVSSHPNNEEAVLLYRKQSFCNQSGIIVCTWNRSFNKWHDGGDQLFDREYVSDWMPLPEVPES